MSLRARLLNRWLRGVEKPMMARAKGADALRRRLELNARLLFHPPRGTQMQWQVMEQDQRRVEVLEVVPRQLSSDTVILYAHGGGFVFGSPRTHAAMLAQLCRRTGARAILPRYRRAPEAPYPAAIDDMWTAWGSLLRSGVEPGQIIIGGDSAGGALALSLLARLIHEKADLPAGVFCFSPLTDMTFSGDSLVENANKEAVLPATRAHEMTQMYLAGQAPDSPLISPLRGDFSDAPPVWITAGDTEILRDDARRMVSVLQAAGRRVQYAEKHDLPHVWPLFHNILPEARASLDELAGWITHELGSPPES
ncbi:Acetyl-hydrolase [Sulfitobacter noctilucae]|uniref:alpha/beta hydrolase n=1 Tax=Sulfitobacter noctilucae TaxID=1342302 RepID=UPI00046951F4|nr:alpha/beta hydrolase [Sulfitobacter noctilucae]KIN75089.1 Acetyl-hydrolase [Sulfitobacter noctilucae]